MSAPGLPSRFVKMSGAGNDFIVFPEAVVVGEAEERALRRLCARGTGVGADGVLFVYRAPDDAGVVVADYFNADGGRARFCANGTRCAARLARLRLGLGPSFTVRTGWGPVGATVAGSSVTLRLPEPVTLGRTLPALGLGRGILPEEALEASAGVPHLVIFVEPGRLDGVDAASWGPPLRRHPDMPEGANVNFVEVRGPSALAVRTFERGVEAETLACGSGVVSADTAPDAAASSDA